MLKSVLVSLLVAFALPTPLKQKQNNISAKPSEIAPRRPECGLFLPERDERHDMARLVRADQFLNCERDGFPKQLAPP